MNGNKDMRSIYDDVMVEMSQYKVRKWLRGTQMVQMNHQECILEPYFLSDSLNIQDFKVPHGPFTHSLHQMTSPELHECICRYELKVCRADVNYPTIHGETFVHQWVSIPASCLAATGLNISQETYILTRSWWYAAVPSGK